jgi:hypothetical protein
LFDEKKYLKDIRVTAIGVHTPKPSTEKERDKNKTIEVDNSFPAFTQSEILKHLL